jgi:hypothetical protein
MIIDTLTELNRIFDLLNTEFFDNKLETPMIIIETKAKKNTLGTCSSNPMWIKKQNEDKNTKYEITLSAQYLNRTIDEIVTTLLHEMIHLYCATNKIQDTSNNCVYHNKKFKEEAEKRGLIISKEETIGWSETTLQDSTKELIKKFKINSDALDYYRKPNLCLTSKIILNKYQCSQCGLKVSHYKEINIVCGMCNKTFEKI